MGERTKDQLLQEHSEVREALVEVVERQRSTITMLLAVLTDLGFDPAEFMDAVG